MRSRNQLQPVDVVKLRGHLVSKQPSGSSRADGPCIYVVGVRPYKIAKSAFVRNLLRTGNNADLVNGSNLRAQTAVHAEKLAVNDGGENEKVENVAACLPYGGVAVLLLAFLVEAVHLCDLARFVVPSDKHNAIWVSMRRQYTEQRRIQQQTYFAFRHMSSVNASKLKYPRST